MLLVVGFQTGTSPLVHVSSNNKADEFFSLSFRVQGLPRRAGNLDSGGPEHPAVHVIASRRVK